MENVKKVIKQADGISTYKITVKGHFVLESDYMGIKSRLSDSSRNIEFGSFLTYLSLYDATRTNMSQYLVLSSFYKALSSVKTEQDLIEMKASLDELRSLGGVINQLYPMLSANLNMGAVANAETYVKCYETMYRAEQNTVKTKNKPQQQEQTQEDDAKQDVGSRDINNIADKTARTVQNANGVDSALKDNYVMHIPEKTSDDLYPHLARIKKILKHYDNNKSEFFIDELRREVFHTFEEIKKQEEIEAFEEFMEDLARQGEAGREFYKHYDSVKGEYVERIKAQSSRFEEFEQQYKQYMRYFDEFEDDKQRGNVDSDNVEEMIHKMRVLEDLLEESKQYISRSQYVKYQEEIERRIAYLKKLQGQLEELKVWTL